MAPETSHFKIPVVDFSPFHSFDYPAKLELAKSIDHAFQTTGFIQLTHHSIHPDMIKEAFSWSQRFFALSHETKMLAPHPPGGSHHRGYSSVGVEKVSQHIFDRAALASLRGANPDVKESFESGNPADAFQPNIWLPEDKLPGFRAFCEEFFRCCTDLVREVLACLETALDIKRSHDLVSAHTSELYQLRLLHYPSVSREILEAGDASRISAHSDFGTLTLLWQDSVGGLQVEDPNRPGEFHDVEPVEGAVVVNVADCLERWSNGRWRSCVHRVVAPPSADGEVDGMTRERYSIPFFAGANPDAVVKALPGCFDESNPIKFEPITAMNYILKRMEALY